MFFQQILDKHRSLAFSECDKGSRFERLMQAYLRTDPQFHLQQVWLWSEFPYRADLGGMDTGIDLAALTADGEYWAVQCKCVQENAVTDKPAVDSFLATSGRSFRDSSSIERRFRHRLWISTTNHWGANAEEALKGQDPAVSRISLHDLLTAPVDWEKLGKKRFFGVKCLSWVRCSADPRQAALISISTASFSTIPDTPFQNFIPALIQCSGASVMSSFTLFISNHDTFLMATRIRINK